MPFVAERVFWKQGKQQTEAQRDAQMVMRAIARTARGASAVSLPSSSSVTLTRRCDSGTGNGTVTYEKSGVQLLKRTLVCKIDGSDVSTVGSEPKLIDGVRSKVATFTPAVNGTVLSVVLDVYHNIIPTDSDPAQHEYLQTNIYMRNA